MQAKIGWRICASKQARWFFSISTACMLASSAATNAAELSATHTRVLVSPADPTDVTGIWFFDRTAGFDFPGEPALTPAAKKIYEAQRDEQKKGTVMNDSTGHCIPPGVPRILNRIYPLQILRSPTDIISLHEYMSQFRFIHMDGRKHPQGDDLIPTFNGDSIGSWDGKTLVVDTIGIKTSVGGWPTQPRNGIRISADFHVVERWSLRQDGQLLVDEITMSDPAVFTTPWKTSRQFKRRDDLPLMEFTCLPEENPISVDATGKDVFTKPGGPSPP